MISIINSFKRTYWVNASMAFITCLLFLIFPSCQKDVLNQDPILNMDGLSSSAISKTGKISYGKVKDVEGNVYMTVKIGKQWLMAENLKTTKYRNGELILTTSDPKLDISLENTPKYQWACGGREDNVATFGRLYTWYAVNDIRGVCPNGWHVPSDAEWETLTDHLINNGYGYEGSGININKSMAATSGWQNSDTEGTPGNDPASNNTSGFSALPGGDRSSIGLFSDTQSFGYWWSSTEDLSSLVWYRRIGYDVGSVYISSYYKDHAFSVRCLK